MTWYWILLIIYLVLGIIFVIYGLAVSKKKYSLTTNILAILLFLPTYPYWIVKVIIKRKLK